MSRRSSILKPAKSRQPLQNVELNTSSAENSPATSTFKLKRRVSFAEKKHVKEFCDSMEQGTVWDNTYEESDLSHKNSHCSNSDENTITAELTDELSKDVSIDNEETIASETVDVSLLRQCVIIGGPSRNLPSANTENTSIFDLKFTGPKCDSVIGDSILNTLPTRIPYPAYHIESISARRSLSVNDCFAGQSAIDEHSLRRARSDSCPATMDSRTWQATREDPLNLDPTKIAQEDCNDAVPMEETIISKVSTKSGPLTEIASVSTRSSITAFVNECPIPNAVIIPTDEPIIDNAKLDEESPETAKNVVGQKKFTIFHDTSMEITEAASNFVKPYQPVQSLTMESREESSLLSAGMTTLGTEATKFGETVSVLETKSSIVGFDNECPMPDASVISSVEPIVDDAKLDEVSPVIAKNSVGQEKFTIFHDASMEMTEAVSNFGKARQPAKSLILESREESSLITPGSSTMLGTKAIKITEAVSKIVDNLGCNEFNSRESGSQTGRSICDVKSMDLTEVVRTTSDIVRSRDTTTEKTTIFNDKSVDFTEIVGNVPFIEKPGKSSSEQTTLFHDKSLEFTDVVRNISIVEQPAKSPTERTKIFHDEIVDFTEVVRNVPCTEEQRESPPGPSTVFHDESLDFTKIVPGVRIVERSFTNDPQPAGSSIIRDRSEVSVVVDAIEKSRLEESLEKSSAEERNISKNRQSELPKYLQIMSSASKLHFQSSVDTLKERMASVVKSLPAIQKPLPMSSELEVKSPLRKRLKSLPNDSIAFTAALPFVMLHRKTTSNDEPTVNPEVVDGDFSEKNITTKVTEAVAESFSLEQQPTGIIFSTPKKEISIFQDKSAKPETSFDPLGSGDSNCDDDYSRQHNTTVLQDESMDITAAVPCVMRAEIIEAEENPKTTIFHDQSMEMTVAVSRLAIPRVVPTSSETLPRDTPENGEAKSMIFRDDSTNLTGALRYQLPSSNANERIRANENKAAKSHSSDPIKFDGDGKTMVFRDECMELTEAVQYQLPSSNAEEEIFADENEAAKSYRNDPKKLDNDGKTMVFRDECMELTEAVQYQLPSSNAEEEIFADENETAKSYRNDPKKLDSDGKTMVFRDECMELTEAVQYQLPSSNAEEEIFADENEAAKSYRNDPKKLDNDGKTMVYRDDCMELTEAVQYQLPSSNARERINADDNEVAKSHWNDSKKLEIDGKTMLFRDEYMELTGAVQYSLNAKETICRNENETAESHRNHPERFDNDGKTMVFRNDCTEAAIADKENCPVGKKDFRPRAIRLFESESLIAESKNDWGEKEKFSRPSSSRMYEKSLQDQLESDGRGRIENFGSDDITGVVAFSSQIDDEHEVDFRTSVNENRALILGNEDLEMTGVVPWKTDQNYEDRPARSSDSSQSFRLVEAADDLPTVDKNHQRSSQVAKELFQKSISSETYVEKNIEPVKVNERTGTADLEDEIRKLAESFELEDESGFDEATFLRQQARCMEDYEANSTASQDCDPATLSVRTDAVSMTKFDESPNSEKCVDWKTSPNLEVGNATGKSHCISSKSLEELRYRAYSVGKFEPEPTGYELTAAIIVPESEKFHKTVMLEDLQAVEPPSFLGDFAESVQSSRSISVLPTESEMGGKVSPCSEDMPNASILELTMPEITQTVNVDRIVNETKNCHTGDRMERKDIRQSQTYVIKKSTYDAPTSISSPLEIDDDRAKNCSSNTGLTMEEFRDPAYSVGKFKPEAMACGLISASCTANRESFHETEMLEDLQAVDPPSFLGDLTESVQSSHSVSQLPTDSEVNGKITDGETRREVHEAISQISEEPGVSSSNLTIPDITQTCMNEIVNDTKNENTGERTEIHRSQTYAMKKRAYNEIISITSSPEVNEERSKNRRRSSTGLTCAGEFSSESPDGPSEKLRRGDNALSTDGKEEKSTKLTSIGRLWDCNDFANSTVIVDDLTRQSIHQCTDETSAVVQNFAPDELPSAIDPCEEGNAARLIDITMEAEVSLLKSPFDVFKETINNLAERFETIWEINLFNEKMLALNFFSNSIVLAIYFNENADACSSSIKAIRFLSQLIEDGTDPGAFLANNLIMKKVDSASLTRSYRTYEDIPEMLDFVTTEVKLGMDFMFELDRLRNFNVMEIRGNRIDFMIRTRDINAGIILKLTMEVKPFAEINSNDITVCCILGSDKVRENDIKRLITNVERDHRFLRFYMNDVKDYVDLMAETAFSVSSEKR